MASGSSQISNQIATQQQVVKPEMCFFCFDVLVSHLNQIKPVKPSFTNDAYPLFVTWTSGMHKKLRGCIGTFEALNLHQGLQDYAIQSATKDGRFQPIKKDELTKLNVSVSILIDFEEAENYLDWKLDVHGIRIEFLDQRGRIRSATYLPDVALEAGWDKEQTIDSLLRKAGFIGDITNDIKQSIKLTRYRSEKLTVTFDEYLSWRNKVE